MRLTDREIDKLHISLAAMIARDRRARGVKLNYPESIAIIASGLMEKARDGHSVAELMAMQGVFLTRDDVMAAHRRRLRATAHVHAGRGAGAP